MISYYIDDKIIVITGFKNDAIKVAVDYDDVDHQKVNDGVIAIVDVLNEARL